MAKSKKQHNETEEDVRWRIYEDTKRRIKKRYNQRAEVISHAIAFAISIPALWFVLLGTSWFSGDTWESIAALGSIGWLIGLSIHLSQHMIYEMRERAINRELDRLGMFDATEKAKRDSAPPERLVRLSDDGEIIDLYNEDDRRDAGISG